ncbi:MULTISPECIES: hypothetical protein [unclassified Halomonas]|uniref:hypothetical protein n=1 Tax=unclassified Halomonas TaxID=2609666 RepID=UPI0006D94AD0|nr:MULTISPECIES: hypothetical protein [unclassified Halomonas]KPQ22118.1 MAG: hypothetical protein HLUCCO06_09890 [Halomonas sp. HL-93]SBR52085.1 hypothetical protein GA0071314_3532 [Halomonas sp. HL-93]SNY98178.1 hypothetical protein SAMN04488142_2797 [Halomonas sp. hl-4]
MHRHIEWDEPGSASVTQLYAKDANFDPTPHTGDILTARYQGCSVRIDVRSYREDDAVSIGDVVAIIDAQGQRLDSRGKLQKGDTVRLPDDKRAMEPAPEE